MELHNCLGSLRSVGINEIVIVDATCERYGDFAVPRYGRGLRDV